MKEEALKLADELKNGHTKAFRIDIFNEASDMIRKLVAELDKQTKPLTDEEAMDIWLHLAINYDSGSFATFFVREIEKRHGIK